MSRRRRTIESGSLYEISCRARSGLPFPARPIVEKLLKSALARALLFQKVSLVDFMWMGNHVHILVVAWDAEELVKFYGELQKNICEYVKRLLGLPNLSLWEGRPCVALIPDIKTACTRKAYFYLNPCRAGLINSVDEYPGYSSWKAFRTAKPTALARVSERVAFIPQGRFKKAPHHDLSVQQERNLLEKLEAEVLCHHRINIFPNLWLAVFGVTNCDGIQFYNAEVLESVLQTERGLREARSKEGFRVIGVPRLRLQSLMRPHTPKVRSRRVFVICIDPELRKKIIAAIDRICDRCIACYHQWRQGNLLVEWPPGTFRPPLRPSASALSI